MKKLIAAAVLSFLALPVATANAEENVNIFINGSPLKTSGFISNDTTYIPLRAVSEALGANVEWHNDTQSVSVTSNEDTRATQLIANVSESVVAIVGNYKSNYLTGTASDYNELTAHGSGVIIKSGGTILTNAHVVKDIQNLTVVLSNGESYAGLIKYIDELSDLAIVQINRLGLKPIAFGSAESTVAGQTVFTIGTPLSLSMRNSATKGIISGVGVTLNDAYYPLLQTDAAINGGNSGGPLVNLKGQLVGINSSKYSGIGIEGMAFSIPLDTVNYVLSQFEQNGKVLRPNLGLTLENSWEARIGLPTSKGVTVKTSSNNILLKGDIVNAINSIEVHSIVDFNKALRDTYSTGSVHVEYTRNGGRFAADIVPSVN